jgi:hypothetical protein
MTIFLVAPGPPAIRCRVAICKIWPHTRLALRVNLSDVPEHEVRSMTSVIAAKVYGFDHRTAPEDRGQDRPDG